VIEQPSLLADGFRPARLHDVRQVLIAAADSLRESSGIQQLEVREREYRGLNRRMLSLVQADRIARKEKADDLPSAVGQGA
jgi:hypothetical protein